MQLAALTWFGLGAGSKRIGRCDRQQRHRGREQGNHEWRSEAANVSLQVVAIRRIAAWTSDNTPVYRAVCLAPTEGLRESRGLINDLTPGDVLSFHSHISCRNARVKRPEIALALFWAVCLCACASRPPVDACGALVSPPDTVFETGIARGNTDDFDAAQSAFRDGVLKLVGRLETTARTSVERFARVRGNEVSADVLIRTRVSTRAFRLRGLRQSASCRLDGETRTIVSLPSSEWRALQRAAQGTAVAVYSCHSQPLAACTDVIRDKSIEALQALGLDLRPVEFEFEDRPTLEQVRGWGERYDAAYVVAVRLAVDPTGTVPYDEYVEHYAAATFSMWLWDTRDAELRYTRTVDKISGGAYDVLDASRAALGQAVKRLHAAAASSFLAPDDR